MLPLKTRHLRLSNDCKTIKWRYFMVKNTLLFALLLVVAFAIVGAGLSLVFSRFIKFSDTGSVETIIPEKIVSQQSHSAKPDFAFNPPSPQDAPKDIKDAVLLGYNITINTRKYAAKYVGNTLTCGNCHSKGGKTGDFLLWEWVLSTRNSGRDKTMPWIS